MVAGVELRDLSVAIDYYEGDLRLRSLRFGLPSEGEPPGRFHGVATMGLVPLGQLNAHFDLTSVPLAALAELVPDLPLDLGGKASGQLTAEAPVEELTDFTTWQATGRLEMPRAVALNRVLQNGSADFSLSQGVATLRSLSAQVAGVPIEASGDLGITAPFPMNLALSVPEGRLDRIAELAPEVPLPGEAAGPYRLAAQVTGSLAPLAYEAEAQLTAGPATIFGASLDGLSLALSLTPERAAVEDLRANLAGGTVRGSATLMFTGDEPGRAELSWRELMLSQLATPEVVGPFDGQVQGRVELTVPPGEFAEPGQWSASGEVAIPRLGTADRRAGELEGSFSFHEGELDYSLTGELFGGRLSLREIPPEEVPAPPPEVEVPEVRLDGPMSQLRVDGLDLNLLTRFFDRRRQSDLTGLVNVDTAIGWDGWPSARGIVTVQGLRFGRIMLAESLRGRLQFQENRLQVVNVSGAYGGGSLQGSADIRLTPSLRASFSLGLSGATVDRAFPWMPAIATTLSGRLDLRLRGEYRRDLRAIGVATLSRGEALGLRVGTARFPIRARYGLQSGRGELRVARTSLGIAGGQAALQATLGLNGGTDVNAQVDFHRVRVGPVLQQTAGAGFLADGPARGQLVLSGRNVRSPRDLRGLLTANFGSVEGSNSPLARAVGPLLGSVGGRPGVFQDGNIRADLANGVWRISQFRLTGRDLELSASGTITLAGRIDLRLAAASLSLDQRGAALRGLLNFIPAVGPIPVGALTRIVDVMQDRTIALAVTGTLQRPRVQVRPLETVTMEVWRNLLRRTPVNLP